MKGVRLDHHNEEVLISHGTTNLWVPGRQALECFTNPSTAGADDYIIPPGLVPHLPNSNPANQYVDGHISHYVKALTINTGAARCEDMMI